MRALINILADYEGALQEYNEDESDYTAVRLEKARENLMEILRLARDWDAAGRPGGSNGTVVTSGSG